MLNYDDVVLRLLSLGYELQEDDEFTLEQAMIEAEQYIMNYCNLESVPEGLKYVATYMLWQFPPNQGFYGRARWF